MDVRDEILIKQQEAENLIYRSFLRAKPYLPVGDDSITRNPYLTRTLLNAVGKPDEGMNIILVTGSKGKGSTSYFISALLKNMGFKVGLFTSPHLVDFTERIRVNGRAIEKRDFIRLCQHIAPAVEQIEAGLEKYQYQGPVGIALAVALLYFREQKVDYAIIEAGRGGAFDDTNVLSNQWAVITSIFAEHLENLGPTVVDVVRHKLGIVKVTTKKVIVNYQEKEISILIKPYLHEKKAEAYLYGEHFGTDDIHMNPFGTQFQISTAREQYSHLELALWGLFQAYNAATALQACEAILNRTIPYETVRETFKKSRWPGRCEIISHDPTTMIDGTINAVSAEYVRQVVQSIGFQKIVTIIGVPEDKDYQGVIQVASSFSSQLILTKPDESHKAFPLHAIEIAKSLMRDCLEINPLSEAIQYAKAQKDVDLILILGTQTLIGNAKRLYHQSLLEL